MLSAGVIILQSGEGGGGSSVFSFLQAVMLKTIAILRNKPDCIYERYNLFLPSGIWSKKLFGLPLLLEVNSPLYEERKKHMTIKLDWLARWSQHYVWKSADYTLPVTKALADYLIQARVKKEQIVVIHNGANTDEYFPYVENDKLKKQYGLEGKIVVGFVGFLRMAWTREGCADYA